jgi:hypothetical protein
VLARERARQQTALDAVYCKLIEGRPVQLEDAVRVKAPLEPYQCTEGAMQWREQRVYPSADLLMYLDGEFPYDQPDKAPPLIWERSIQILITAVRHRLAVDIAPLLLAWTQPCGQASWLTRVAKQRGLQPRKWAQHYLEQFKEPHPDLGQRVWRIPVDAETTSIAEVLTHLVIVALKQEFPVSLDDQQMALQWVQHVVQEGLRRLGEVDSQQVSKEVVGEVFEALWTRFDLPATPWALQDFIKTTAQGCVHDARKKDARQPREPWTDPTTGERRYPDALVAQECGVNARTVARWRANQGITGQGLLESQFIRFRQEHEPKWRRKRLQAIGEALGLGKETVRKIVQRGEQKGLPEDSIQANLERNAAKRKHHRAVEATVPSEDAPSLEELCMSLQARLHEVQTEDERIKVLDKLQHLRQRQKGS